MEGAASLAAFGTGRGMTEENYTAGKVVSYHGKMLAIVRSGYETGTVKLTVSAEGLAGAKLDIIIE